MVTEDYGAASYRRFLEGDKSAPDEIMDRYFKNLVFFINGYLHDIHSSEDIALDVMSDLFVYRHRYNFKVSLKTYLFMIGRSRAIDLLRHRKVIDFTDLSDAENLASDEEIPAEALIADERKRALHRALRSLKSDMRDAVYLVYFEDLSYDEAAKVMKKSRKQIDNLIYTAKKGDS